MLAPLLATLALAHAPIDFNAQFATTLPAVKAKTSIPVLYPDTMPSDWDQVYPSGGATKREYSLSVFASPDCAGANVCFIATVTGQKGGTPFGRGKVTLRGGRHGRYQPLSCGASCSQPSISWKQGGVTYQIQADVEASKATDRQALISLANQAIKRGPR